MLGKPAKPFQLTDQSGRHKAAKPPFPAIHDASMLSFGLETPMKIGRRIKILELLLP